MVRPPTWVVQQWNYSQTATSAPTTADPINSSLVQNGSNLSFNGVNIITNADQGALYSWRVDLWDYCAQENDGVCGQTIDTVIENH